MATQGVTDEAILRKAEDALHPPAARVPGESRTLAALTQCGEGTIRDHEDASTRLVTATEALFRLKGQRAAQKAGAILRLRQQGYTETNAKDFAQLDPDYAAHKADVAAAEVEREEALYATENARLRAELTRAVVEKMGGVN